jgi:hypothetical protein
MQTVCRFEHRVPDPRIWSACGDEAASASPAHSLGRFSDVSNWLFFVYLCAPDIMVIGGGSETIFSGRNTQ